MDRISSLTNCLIQNKMDFLLKLEVMMENPFLILCFLKKIRGWDGLLVEASPFLYNIMLKKDRKCYMVNACISTRLPTMTFVLAGGIETLTDMHRRRIARDRITYGKDANWANTNDTATVNCFPLLQLMKIKGALISIIFL